MGCGTGAMTRYLDAHGYDMTGIDVSEEMLTIAKEKSSPDILYLLQDMREFELYGTMRAAVSICDSMNYILEEDDLLQVFSLVNNYLDPGGIFIFDLNTVYKYQEILGEQTIAEDREECSFCLLYTSPCFGNSVKDQYAALFSDFLQEHNGDIFP